MHGYQGRQGLQYCKQNVHRCNTSSVLEISFVDLTTEYDSCGPLLLYKQWKEQRFDLILGHNGNVHDCGEKGVLCRRIVVCCEIQLMSLFLSFSPGIRKEGRQKYTTKYETLRVSLNKAICHVQQNTDLSNMIHVY